MRSHSLARATSSLRMGAVQLKCAQAQCGGGEDARLERRPDGRKRVEGTVVALPGGNDVRHRSGDLVCRVVSGREAEQRVAEGDRRIRDPIAILQRLLVDTPQQVDRRFDLLTRS